MNEKQRKAIESFAVKAAEEAAREDYHVLVRQQGMTPTPGLIKQLAEQRAHQVLARHQPEIEAILNDPAYADEVPEQKPSFFRRVFGR